LAGVVTGPTAAVQAAAAPADPADPAASADTDLPTTGSSDVGLKVMVGVFLIGLGLMLVTAAHRREQLERLAWPDER
jgi:hypothetical protein